MDAVEDAQADGGLSIVVQDTIIGSCPVRVKVRLLNDINVTNANSATEEPMDAIAATTSVSNLNVMDVVDDVLENVMVKDTRADIQDGLLISVDAV